MIEMTQTGLIDIVVEALGLNDGYARGKHTPAETNCGMVINPTMELCIDAYPDADFAGMYGHEKPTDPACAKLF